jgi:aminopeptidase YwaD
MKRWVPWVALVCVLAGIAVLFAQEREDRTLLDWTQMRAIINEASGERAMHHVLELVPYPRVRRVSEYEGHFRESEVMERFAKEYGYSNVEIESFETQAPSWYASQGELWMVQPEQVKLFDIYDVAIALGTGSETGDVTAELVDVSSGGREQDYAGKNVTGKIVMGSAGLNALQQLAVFGHGAAGVISFNTLYPESQPDILLSQGISANAPQGRTPGFGWAITTRAARELQARLGRGEKVVMRSVVKSQSYKGEMEVVHATIPGDGSTDQAIVISGHLYEGYIKQGANDDSSGCAVTLEMGRTFIRLVKEGKLPKPKRTIHFLWVPEISGTNAWLAKHADVKSKLIADLNFDMEGLGLTKGRSLWTLDRTPDTFPSFLNDVAQSTMEFVANTNRERVRFRARGYAFSLPVLAANGSRDPFFISVDKHYGASDHVVYMNNGIPAVIFATWPDPWYHSSQDTPDKLDSTQFKRVAVVGTAAMTVLATADDVMAARVAAESLGRSAERMGEAERKGLGYMADATNDVAQLHEAYKEARNAVRHQTEVEKGVIRSSAVLYASADGAKQKLLGKLEEEIEQRGVALQNEVKTFYQAQAQRWGATPAEPVPTELEKQAARLIVERVAGGGPGGGGGGGGFGAMQAAIQKLSPDERPAVEAALAKIPQHMTAELNILVGKKRTVLEIRDFLAGEFDPLPLADAMEYFHAQEKLGLMKLTQKPEEPKPAAPLAKKRAKPAKKS